MKNFGNEIDFLENWEKTKDVSKIAKYYEVTEDTIINRLNKLGKGKKIILAVKKQKLIQDYDNLFKKIADSVDVLDKMIVDYKGSGTKKIPHSIVLSAIREMRESVKMALEIKKIYKSEIDIAVFIEIVISEVNKESTAVAHRIMERIQKLDSKKFIKKDE